MSRSVLAALLAAGVCVSSASRLRATDEDSPIARAVSFLARHQVETSFIGLSNGVPFVDVAGNWPQYFTLKENQGFRVRDVSPFAVAFIHHALTHIVERNRETLDLSPSDLRTARSMRRRAVGLMRAFESPPGMPDAGTVGFWPYDADPRFPDPFLTLVLTAWLQGPILGGQRVPINLAVFPGTLAIPSDADVTATTYTAILDDALLDDGSGSTARFERFFADWRDLGIFPRRLNPEWLPRASGAFLTWLTYRNQLFPLFPNDVDLVVNANVLYALGRYERLDLPGVAEAIALINQAAALGLHRGRTNEIGDYYPDNLAFQYAVSRAFHEGRVSGVAPAVDILADDLEASVHLRADGTAYWDMGDPELNTAFAVLTLLNAGRDTPLVDGAIEYLIAQQDESGGFEEATFFIGRTTGGPTFEFKSRSFTTAMVLEAFARYGLARCGHEMRSSLGQVRLCG